MAPAGQRGTMPGAPPPPPSAPAGHSPTAASGTQAAPQLATWRLRLEMFGVLFSAAMQVGRAALLRWAVLRRARPCPSAPARPPTTKLVRTGKSNSNMACRVYCATSAAALSQVAYLVRQRGVATMREDVEMLGIIFYHCLVLGTMVGPPPTLYQRWRVPLYAVMRWGTCGGARGLRQEGRLGAPARSCAVRRRHEWGAAAHRCAPPPITATHPPHPKPRPLGYLSSTVRSTHSAAAVLLAGAAAPGLRGALGDAHRLLLATRILGTAVVGVVVLVPPAVAVVVQALCTYLAASSGYCATPVRRRWRRRWWCGRPGQECGRSDTTLATLRRHPLPAAGALILWACPHRPAAAADVGPPHAGAAARAGGVVGRRQPPLFGAGACVGRGCVCLAGLLPPRLTCRFGAGLQGRSSCT